MRATNASASSKGGAQASGDELGVKRFAGGQRAPFNEREVGVAADLSYQPLGRETGRLFNGCPNEPTERKDGFVNRHEVSQVPHFSASGGGHDLVHAKIDGVQDIAEGVIPDGGEKAKIAIGKPFKPGIGASLADFGGVQKGQLPQPDYAIARQLECLGIH